MLPPVRRSLEELEQYINLVASAGSMLDIAPITANAKTRRPLPGLPARFDD
jgi:hypothetical protein